jgi:hypothetical protein
MTRGTFEPAEPQDLKSPGQNSAWGYLSFIGKVDTVFE